MLPFRSFDFLKIDVPVVIVYDKNGWVVSGSFDDTIPPRIITPKFFKFGLSDGVMARCHKSNTDKFFLLGKMKYVRDANNDDIVDCLDFEEDDDDKKPTYITMIVEAITTLSKNLYHSRAAIKKWIIENHAAHISVQSIDRALRNAFRKGVEDGILVQQNTQLFGLNKEKTKTSGSRVPALVEETKSSSENEEKSETVDKGRWVKLFEKEKIKVGDKLTILYNYKQRDIEILSILSTSITIKDLSDNTCKSLLIDTIYIENDTFGSGPSKPNEHFISCNNKYWRKIDPEMFIYENPYSEIEKVPQTQNEDYKYFDFSGWLDVKLSNGEIRKQKIKSIDFFKNQITSSVPKNEKVLENTCPSQVKAKNGKWIDLINQVLIRHNNTNQIDFVVVKEVKESSIVALNWALFDSFKEIEYDINSYSILKKDGGNVVFKNLKDLSWEQIETMKMQAEFFRYVYTLRTDKQ